MPVLSTLGAAIANVYGFTSGLIKDQYFNLVSLLLPGNGTNGAQNNTFLDSSTNNFTITRNGDTTQGTFSPFSQTGWGGNFNGTSFIQAPDNATMQVGTSDFTIEMWAYFTSDFSGSKWLGGKGDQSTAAGTAFSFYSSAFEVYSGSTSYSLTCPTWSSNRWYHIAIVKSGTSTNNLKLYIDGSVQSQASIGSNSVNSASGNGLKIGAYSSAGVASYISNFRFVKGRAVYTSAFTPPTSPLGVTSGGQNPPQGTETSLLVLQSNRFVDVANNYTLTLSSNPSVTPFSPFAPTSSYSAAAVGGSGYFDGSGDFLSVADSSAFTLGTNAFTAEAWVYPTTSGTSRMILGQYEDADNTGSFLLYLNTGNKLVCIIPALSITIAGATNVPANAWSHVVITRSGSSFAIFLNGSRDASPATNSGSLTDSTYAFTFGADRDGNNLLYTGYIASARLVNGTAVYDPTQTSITVPTAPLTAITNTSLLLNFTNAGVVDATAKNVLETEGNAQISTAQSKWGGGSISFDGTGDGIFTDASVSTTLNALGTGDFCIEFWIYFNSLSGTPNLFDMRPVATQGVYPSMYVDTSKIYIYVNSANLISGTTTMSTGVWYHVAWSRISGSSSLYIAGTRQGSAVSDTNNYLCSRIVLGIDRGLSANPLNGYIDDVRITKGNGRGYTGSTITVPTAPFPLQ